MLLHGEHPLLIDIAENVLMYPAEQNITVAVNNME